VLVSDDDWRDQFQRIERSLQLIIGEGVPAPVRAYLDYKDIVFHFCTDVFHLADWIAAYLSEESDPDEVTRQIHAEAIKPSAALSACTDVANGYKHLDLTRKSFTSGTKSDYSRIVGVSFYDNFADPAVTRFTINTSDGNRDAVDVAKDAVADWIKWFNSGSELACRIRQQVDADSVGNPPEFVKPWEDRRRCDSVGCQIHRVLTRIANPSPLGGSLPYCICRTRPPLSEVPPRSWWWFPFGYGEAIRAYRQRVYSITNELVRAGFGLRGQTALQRIQQSVIREIADRDEAQRRCPKRHVARVFCHPNG
jgi:hypothetical protein